MVFEYLTLYTSEILPIYRNIIYTIITTEKEKPKLTEILIVNSDITLSNCFFNQMWVQAQIEFYIHWLYRYGLLYPIHILSIDILDYHQIQPCL
jgi:hypothetical protein